jgi:response regulator RpfG family c-di-GMP phosphodiesterase
LEKILLVDDEQSVLDGFRRQLRNNFDIDTAISGNEGLKKIAVGGPFAVIISDMRMPVMDGITFLLQVCKAAPESVRMMLTGNSDQQTAVDAINRGAIFRFLAKPCSPENLTMAIEAGIKQYRLVTAEKELLEQTLMGSINILMDILSLAYPAGFSQAIRLRKYATQIARKLNLFEPWRYELAAMLSSIGFINMPTETIEKYMAGAPLSKGEEEMAAAIPQNTGTLLANIPRLSIVAAMIAQRDLVDKEPLDFASREEAEMIRIGAKILKVITSFDILLIQNYEPKNAIKMMTKGDALYNSAILGVLKTIDFPHKGGGLVVSYVKVNELRKGMIIDTDIFNSRGVLIIPKGYEANEMTVERLNNFLLTQNSLNKEGFSKENKELAERLDTMRKMKIDEFKKGMITGSDIFNAKGTLIIAKGYEVNEATAQRLNNFLSTQEILIQDILTQGSLSQESKNLAERLDNIRVLIPTYNY